MLRSPVQWDVVQTVQPLVLRNLPERKKSSLVASNVWKEATCQHVAAHLRWLQACGEDDDADKHDGMDLKKKSR